MTRPWTPERHAAAKTREAKALKGPWQVNRMDSDGGAIVWQVQQAIPPSVVVADISDGDTRYARATATLIAESRTDLPDALDEIERMAPIAALVPGLEQANREAHQDIAKVKAALKKRDALLRRLVTGWDDIGLDVLDGDVIAEIRRLLGMNEPPSPCSPDNPCDDHLAYGGAPATTDPPR